MATTTRVLDANVNGTVYTSNVNGALEAIDTCHSGTTAPTDEVANGKFWLDTTTTPAILKMYNNATWEIVHSSASINVAASGDVGVGAGAVNGYKLAVNGNALFGGTGAEGGEITLRNPDGTTIGGALDLSSADNLRLFQTTNNSTMQIGQLSGTGGTIEFYTAGTANMTINAAGTVTATAFAGDGSGITGLPPVPTGAVFMFMANTAPTGYLKANGSTISRTTYADLFAVVGTTFGVGDGSTTFQIPDLRGEFLRSWDDGRGVDTARVFGSAQSDGIKTHYGTGSFTTSNSGSPSNPGGKLTGAHAVPTSSPGFTNMNGVTTEYAGETETRSRNVALLACIKY